MDKKENNKEEEKFKVSGKCSYDEVKKIICRIVEIILIFCVIVVSMLTLIKMLIEQNCSSCIMDYSSINYETEFVPGVYTHTNEDGTVEKYTFVDGYVTYEVGDSQKAGLYAVHSETIELVFEESLEIGGVTQDVTIASDEEFSIKNSQTITKIVQSATTGEDVEVDYELVEEN